MTAATLEGIVPGLDEQEYHRHPALSSTGARLLLDSPARFHYRQEHPEAPKKAFDVGTAAHKKVLGVGAEVVAIPDELLASNGAVSTKAAKEWVEEARSAGRVPVKAEIVAEVDAMAESVLAHPAARWLLEQDGTPEASVFAHDGEFDVHLRARFDFLPNLNKAGRIAFDLKTTGTRADKNGFEKSVADRRYDVQRGHYLDTLHRATGRDDLEMVFIVVESEAPHLVAVHQLSMEFRGTGHDDARRARDIYRQCVDSGRWPGYSDDITLIQPPGWFIAKHEEKYPS